MDAFDFRNEQLNRILDLAEALGGPEVLFQELLLRMSNGELEEFADDIQTNYSEELGEV